MYIGTSGRNLDQGWKIWQMKMLESLVVQPCLTLCDPMDCSPPGSSVHGIFQARVLEWVAIFFSRGSSQPRDRTWVSHIVSRCFTDWATREVMNIYFNFNFKLITNFFFFYYKYVLWNVWSTLYWKIICLELKFNRRILSGNPNFGIKMV